MPGPDPGGIGCGIMRIAGDYLKRTSVSLLPLVIALVTMVGDLPADSVKACHYLETVGERFTDTAWCLVTSAQNQLFYQTADEINIPGPKRRSIGTIFIQTS